ncbi:MAG: glycosyltransferase family 4 protein [Candidatus Kapabacteria bacterium]|nr:glycosyltransferase family 4 protein [Candidatus Kapabacteria bacterium]
MAKRLRILQLSPQFPYPSDDGGKIGIANIFQEFSGQGNEVHFFCATNRQISQEARIEAEKYGNIKIVQTQTSNTIPKILASLFSDKPLFLSKLYTEKLKLELTEFLNNNEIDVIHADHASMAPLGQLARKITGKPLGLRMHNIEHLIWERYSSRFSSYHPARAYLRRQAKLLKVQESNIFQSCDINFPITEQDKNFALTMAPKANYRIASAGVNPNLWLPDDSIQRSQFLLTHASPMDWTQNVEGIRWFLNNILPVIKAEFTDCELNLIGRQVKEVFGNNETAGLKPIGYVDKVQPWYNKANLYIAPLFVGSGIRIKILEAMAMELPVVATSIAAEGITGTEREGLFICENQYKMIDKIKELMLDYDRCRALGKAARKFVIENYSWTNSVSIMIEEYWKLHEQRSKR